MIRIIQLRSLCALLAASWYLLAQTPAHANIFYTGLAEVYADAKSGPDAGTPIQVPDVQVIMFKGNDSLAFTNTYGLDALNRPLIRTIAVTTLQLYDTVQNTYSPIGFNGNQVVTAVTIIDGYLESTTTSTGTAFFTSGRTGLFTVATNNDFVPDDPSTWGIVATASDGSLSLNNPISTYVLKPPEDVRDALQAGAPILSDVDGVDFTASHVNRSTVDFTPTGHAIGNLLFKEDPANIGILGNQFITVTDPVVPPALFDSEGYFVQYSQKINSAKTGEVTNGEPDPPPPGNTAPEDLKYLNFIASAFGGYAALPGGSAGQAWATGITTGLGSDFSTTYDGGASDAAFANRFFGDFVAQYDAEQSNEGELRGVRPGVETLGVLPVPEPSTFALAGMGLVGLVAGSVRRRQIGRKAA